MTYTAVKPTENPPAKPGEWTLAQIIDALSKPLPSNILETKRIAGRDITYIPWHKAVLVLNKYAPGWRFRVKSIQQIGDELVLAGSLSIPTADAGIVTRESTGSEKLTVNGYGEAAANAESQCFRRCCARFGLGLYLYQR